MAIVRPSGRVVIAPVPGLAVCRVTILENATQDVGVDVMGCCAAEIEPCIAQGASKTIQFVDAATVDYGGATEITFDVWQGGIGGTSLLAKSLSGVTITIAAQNIFNTTISNAESLAMPAGYHWCEAWVTLSTGARRMVGAGMFEVMDTRKHDA